MKTVAHSRRRRLMWNLSLVLVVVSMASTSSAGAVAQSDPQAVEVAERVLEQMGGREAWDATRYIKWNFMGRRAHYWDKWTGNHRIESGDRIVLWNVNTRRGRVWENGQEVTDPAAMAEALDGAWRTWVNDTYWMFMPYKLLDPGVTLSYMGEQPMQDGRSADVLQLTFDNVGVTPQNRYLVYVAKDTGLVEQWSYFANASDEEPGFTLPWTGWQRFGRIMLATDKGRGRDWAIEVYDELPESVFTSPEPVQIR